MSQEALAYDAQLNRTYVTTLEAGRRCPSLVTMEKLAVALDVTLSEFIVEYEKRKRAIEGASRVDE